MDKSFHLFIRHLPSGYAAQVLTHPHLASFGPELTAVRSDLGHVLTKLLERGDLTEEITFFPEARLRRLDVSLRAVQARRLIEVPLRFSVVSLPGGGSRRRSRPLAAGETASHLRFLVPRLGLEATLDASAAELEGGSRGGSATGWTAWVEEMIRHSLHLAPLQRLLNLTWTGPESLETLTVAARPPEKRVRSVPAVQRQRIVLPPGLGEACRRLNDEVAGGTLERAFQREPELGLLSGILGARTRPSVLLLGPEGAGKTCLVHELAHRAQLPGTPLHGLEVWTTSAGRIVAGMRYLGEWQGRLERMLGELRQRRAVLHLESLAELVSLGHGSDVTDLARFLTPAVESGEVTLILEATAEDAARAERTHAALISALRPLAVGSLPPAAARLALTQVAHALGRQRKVRFEDSALGCALDLAERFGSGALPGEAVTLLRAAAAGAPPERSEGSRTAAVSADRVTASFTARTGYPRALIDPAIRLDPDQVLAWLRGRVEGQDEATELLANLVVTLKTNLADPSRPLGSFLFLGPTGVGKTESALALAAYLFGDVRRLHRFDMAEYASPGSAARLVSASGAQPGLARRVREQPFGVVLLDEIEKADAGVHDLLLQVLGEGRLGDGSGRTVSFRNTVVILTSNLGADGAGRSLGFAAGPGGSAAAAHYRGAAAAFFRPELLNRFDQIVPYRPLSPEVVQRLARRLLAAALAREGLLRRGLQVDFDDAVVARLAELGFDARLGARPLKRAIETHVVAPLARRVARTAHRAQTRLLLKVDATGTIVVA